MTLSISQATLEDLPALVGLLTVLFAQEADFTADLAKQQRGLQLIIEQPTVGRIYCARQENQVVGMVSLLFTISTAEGGRVAWLEDMIVQPDQRGCGIGEQLLRHALAEARAADCSRITLLTDNTNQAAMQFYGRVGFVRSAMAPFRLHLS
ncbi:GNAT family N-acetyltransferase [soil metagenome]